MIGFLTADPERRRPTRATVTARVLTFDPTLVPGSDSFRAAAVLIAGHEIGHNIDRIARLTGVSREGVARMARRLVDNGVWSAGDTVSRWCDSPDEHDSFLSDVGVAEGKLCRRTDEFGRLEWAPPGYWRKEFEYVGAKGDDSARPVRYYPHVEVPEAECLFVPDDELEGEEALEGESVDTAARPDRAPQRTLASPDPIAEAVPDDVAHVWMGGDGVERAVDEEDPWQGSLAGALGAPLQDGAVWLGWQGSTPQTVGD